MTDDPTVATVKGLFTQAVLDAMRRVSEGYPPTLDDEARLAAYQGDVALVGSTLGRIFTTVS